MTKKWKKKITVIILSLNRPNYLRRTVEYYLGIGLKIIVVDGSIKKNRFTNNNNLIYINSKTHYYTRLAIAEKKLKTKYYIIANDDEFFLEDGLARCVKFLDNNKSFIGSCGRSLVFTYLNKSIFAYEGYKYFYNNKLNFKRKIDRVNVHTKLPTVQGYNSVLRKKVLGKIVYFLKNFKQRNNIFLNEFFINLIIILSGRLHIINHLMWFRSQENKIITNRQWMRSGKMQNFYIFFHNMSMKKKNLLVKKFCQINKVLELFESILIQMIIRSKSQYYLYQSKKSSKSIFSNYFFNLLSKIKNHNSIFNYLGNFVKNKYFYKKFYGDKIDKLISDFEMKKMKVSNLNVQDITKKILNFYND
tara:strand:+ start:1104 stop:2183 length:1080 start_codon:yes stop_codon:yes gene_type:complete